MNLVSKTWLLARLFDQDIVIADCRFALQDPAAGRLAYAQRYIPGAVYFDLNEDLSAPVTTHGGRHPLPDVQTLSDKFSRAGIGPDTHVIAYDDQGGAMASRLWWLLKYLGHERVSVMEEGFSAWQAAGYPIADTPPPIRVPRRFAATPNPQMVASMEEVKVISEQGGARLIDSREPARYAGLEEAIDPKAGHIPGATNYFWKNNLQENGAWKDTAELATGFATLDKSEPIIVYCGSGVTACPNVLALTASGFTNVRLYAGSWSDWVSYSENPVATGEEQKPNNA